MSLIQSPLEQPLMISSSATEDRREKLSRYRNKKTKRNFGRRIKVTKQLILSCYFGNYCLVREQTANSCIFINVLLPYKSKKEHSSMEDCLIRLFSDIPFLSQYACRKALADSQPRIRGRFAKTEESDVSKRQ